MKPSNCEGASLEFRKKITTNYFEASDLLGDITLKIRVCDAKIAQSNIEPGSNILVWLEKYPKFSSLGHFVLQLPDYIVEDLIAEFNALAISFGYVCCEAPVKQYLSEHLLAF